MGKAALPRGRKHAVRLAFLVTLLTAGCLIAIPTAASAAVSSSMHAKPGGGVSGVTQLCGPDPAYSCTSGGYSGQSTGWPGTLYGAGYASSNTYGYHNCTLYAAYRLASNGLGNPGWSANANGWATSAYAAGTPVDQTPAVGSIAQWNSGLGHVAYVEAVTSTYIEITDDNYGLNTTDRFRIATTSPAWPDNFIHSKDMPDGSTSLSLTAPLVTTAPSGLYAGVPINQTFTVHNGTTAAITAKYLIMALRDPHGANYDQTCAINLILPPGASRACVFSNPWGSTGTYTIWPDWEDSTNTWHYGQLGAPQTFTLAATPALAATSPLATAAPSGLFANVSVGQSFTIKNTTASTITASSLAMAVRDPHGVNYDKTCASNLTLAPSASYTCTFSYSWGSTGTYTLWPDWRDTAGAWHMGQLGPTQTFVLTTTPSLIAASPLTITAASGYYVGAPIGETFTLTNTTGGSLTAASVILAVRDPYGLNYDQICATNLSLAANASFTCTLSQQWGSAGMYNLWPDWKDTTGNWHYGELGPVQTFTLS